LNWVLHTHIDNARLRPGDLSHHTSDTSEPGAWKRISGHWLIRFTIEPATLKLLAWRAYHLTTRARNLDQLRLSQHEWEKLFACDPSNFKSTIFITSYYYLSTCIALILALSLRELFRSALHSHLHNWLCFLGNTRVTTAQFWRRSVISSFHSVRLHSPVIFFTFFSARFLTSEGR
jgi:hypothetical protein